MLDLDLKPYSEIKSSNSEYNRLTENTHIRRVVLTKAIFDNDVRYFNHWYNTGLVEHDLKLLIYCVIFNNFEIFKFIVDSGVSVYDGVGMFYEVLYLTHISKRSHMMYYLLGRCCILSDICCYPEVSLYYLEYDLPFHEITKNVLKYHINEYSLVFEKITKYDCII